MSHRSSGPYARAAGARKCGVCGETGHNRRTCPDVHGAAPQRQADRPKPDFTREEYDFLVLMCDDAALFDTDMTKVIADNWPSDKQPDGRPKKFVCGCCKKNMRDTANKESAEIWMQISKVKRGYINHVEQRFLSPSDYGEQGGGLMYPCRVPVPVEEEMPDKLLKDCGLFCSSCLMASTGAPASENAKFFRDAGFTLEWFQANMPKGLPMLVTLTPPTENEEMVKAPEPASMLQYLMGPKKIMKREQMVRDKSAALLKALAGGDIKNLKHKDVEELMRDEDRRLLRENPYNPY